jgi:hypothetical protein
MRDPQPPRRVEIYRAASVIGGPWVDVEAVSPIDAEEKACELLGCRLDELVLRYVVTRYVAGRRAGKAVA